MKVNKGYILVLLFLGLIFCNINIVFAQIKAIDIENPKSKGLTNWVNNQDNILSSQTVGLLNDKLNRLYDSTSVQIAVVVIKGDKQTAARELSMELFDIWHPGMKDKDNGMIILVVTQARQCFFRTGYGIEDVITDAVSTRIFNRTMKQYFIAQNWDKGVLEGTDAIINRIYKYYENPSSLQEKNEENSNNARIFFIAYLFMGLIVFLFAVHNLDNSIKEVEHTHRSKRVNSLKSSLKSNIIVICIFGIWFAPIYYILYKRKLKKIRNEKIFCSCGSEMKLLSEKQEDEFLNHTQQLEEKLKSRDYDVWLCPQCNKTTIYCYEENSSYEICPSCHAKAYKKISEEVIQEGNLRPKTIIRSNYYCKNCHHRHHSDKEMNDTDSLLQGAVLGSMLGGMSSGKSFSSGGFGGGFSGGSFGGGFSGGGGGGGSW